METLTQWSILVFGAIIIGIAVYEVLKALDRQKAKKEEAAKPKHQYVGKDYRIIRHRELADQMQYWSDKVRAAKTPEQRLQARKGMLTISNAIHDLYV